ncbi:MAG: ADOP family duplicated permease [Acidobacteriota bacterium]|nr:ADOP family duplicated permease [Acidobacteriota bacterium]
MHDLRADLRSFLRTCTRWPGLSAAVMGILALGIAATVVVYGLVDALVLDPFPYPQSERLVVVGSEMPRTGRELGFFERLSAPEIEELRQRSRTLGRFLPFDLNSVRVQGEDFPVRLFALFTWRDPFEALGVAPHLGRGFAAEELESDGAAAVVSYELWQSFYGGDPKVLGSILVADGVAYTVIGVAPPASSVYGADLWLPLRARVAHLPREQRHFNLLARMAPGADLSTVNAELAALAGASEAALPEVEEYENWRLEATTWGRFNAFAYEDEAALALGAMILMLLLVSANVANLLMTRAASRREEISVRRALGASTGSIVRQVLVESFLFTVSGGVLGWVLASWGLGVALAWLPAHLRPPAEMAAFDGSTYLVAAAATVVTALILGLPPAWHLGRHRLRFGLGTAGRASEGRGARRAHRLMVIAQVAAAAVLLSGAAAVLSAWLQLAHQDPGFPADRLLSMRLSLPAEEYEGEAVPRFFERLQQEVASLPGVQGASVATQVAPNTFFSSELRLEGELPDGASPRLFHTVVGDGYFQALGLKLLRGRVLDDRDRSRGPCALVLNELAADRYFPSGEELGSRARVLGSRFDSGWCEVVGVVAAVRNQGPGQPAAPEIYTSHRQAGGRYNQMFLVVRSAGEPADLVAAIRSAVVNLDAQQPVYAITTGEGAIASQLASRRITAQLLAAFALVAVLLAALGIYGVVAYGVARRQREMGLRLALGADPGRVAALVIGESLLTVGIGLALGLVGGFALTRLLQTQLAALAELDPSLLLVPVACLTLAAVLAAALPARRAGRVPPAEVLRQL